MSHGGSLRTGSQGRRPHRSRADRGVVRTRRERGHPSHGTDCRKGPYEALFGTQDGESVTAFYAYARNL